MTFIFKKVESSSKKELLSLFAKHYKVLDSNLEIVASSLSKGGKTIWDLVGIDNDKRFVLVGIELQGNNDMLYDILDRLEWAWEHIDIIARICTSSVVDRNLIPRAIIISPSYSSSFKKIISYLTDQKINLFTFTHMASEEGRGILLERVEIPKKNDPVPVKDVSFIQSVEIPHLAKVTSEEIKEFLR